MAKASKKKAAKSAAPKKRVMVMQTDVPSCSLDQALRVPKAIADNYAFDPTTPLRVAEALEMKPTSSTFKMLCGAAIAYGLTEGGYNASAITPTPLAKRILKPLEEGDDQKAMRECVLKPRVIKEFLEKYDGSKLPKQSIAVNVLQELGVPEDRSEGVLEQIQGTAKSLGFLRDIKGDPYVDLDSIAPSRDDQDPEEPEYATDLDEKQVLREEVTAPATQHSDAGVTAEKRLLKKVFITHGKNKKFVDPIKQLLTFGDLTPVVSVERESVSKPVPDKVMDDMRSCGAAIIHVDAEIKVMDQEGKEKILLNENVLIEIGAAMALYGRRFILLVRDGVRLPSNLQGLYEVRYDGDELGSDGTIRLMKAINEIKAVALPN